MKTIVLVVVVLALAAAVQAKSKVAERLKVNKAEDASATKDKQDNVAATQLGSSSNCNCQQPAQQASCGCGSSPSIVSSIGGGGSSAMSSWKEQQEQLLANMGPRPSVDEAVRPIDDWMKDFDARTQLHGSLWESAKATVAPLIKKLERSQVEAMDRLRESNRAIRMHVEEAATEHVFNLLRSKQAVDDAEQSAIHKKEEMADAKEQISASKDRLTGAQDGVKALQERTKTEKKIEEDARKKAGVQGSSANSTAHAVSDTINKILKEKL